MEICEQNEAFIEEHGELIFSHTKVILRKDDQFYYATTGRRHSSVDLTELECVPIPTSQIWPPFPSHFTHAPDPLPGNCYVKQPSLLHYEKASTIDIAGLLLHEAHICELLRMHPHPNIAQYLGCIVKNNRIAGLCFKKYEANLSEWKRLGHSLDQKSCIQGIKDGVEHLHHLGIIHCDINPNNIMMNGTIPVVIDFDSCRQMGETLGLKVGTRGWTREEFDSARPENDHFGISKIQTWLFKQS